MRSYHQFCPVAKAAEIFAERWTPLILRELLMGSHRFNEIENGLPRISRSLLSQRLRSLEQVGLIERRLSSGGHGHVPEYHLTQAGQELFEVIERLGQWGQRWVNTEIGQDDVEPALLMWDMRRRIRHELIPQERLVIQFDFTGLRRERYWLVIEHGDASVCKDFPGFEPDVEVTTDTMTLHRIWVGHQDFGSALRSGALRLQGPSELVRSFPNWFALSMFAHVKPAETAPRRDPSTHVAAN